MATHVDSKLCVTMVVLLLVVVALLRSRVLISRKLGFSGHSRLARWYDQRRYEELWEVWRWISVEEWPGS